MEPNTKDICAKVRPFSELKVGEWFTIDQRLLTIRWMKLRPIEHMGRILNAISNGGYLVSFPQNSPVSEQNKEKIYEQNKDCSYRVCPASTSS